MKADETPVESTAAPDGKKSPLSAGTRRKLNAILVPLKKACAVNFPPDDLSGPAPRPQLIVVRMPRSGAGRPPRGPVQIPPPRWAKVNQSQSKHAKGRGYPGAYGKSGGQKTFDSTRLAADTVAGSVGRDRKKVVRYSRIELMKKARELMEFFRFGRRGAKREVQA